MRRYQAVWLRVAGGMASHVRPSNKRPARFLFTPPHCLKKKGRRLPALVADIHHPGSPWPRAGAGLAADDDPVNPVQVQVRQRAEQRLQGQELRRGPGLPQIVYARDILSFSTVTPIQIFGAHGRSGLRSSRRSERFVRTW